MNILDALIGIGLFFYLLAGATGWGWFSLILVFRLGQEQNEYPRSTAEKWYLASVLGVGIISLLALLLGLAQLFFPAVAWGLITFGLLLGAVMLIRFRRNGVSSCCSQSTGAKDSPLGPRIFFMSLALLCIGSLLYILLVRVFVPPIDWDEIAYHMALPKLYVQSHGIVYAPSMVMSNWPMNTEMVFTLGLLLGSELVAHLTTWWMALSTAWGLYLIGKRYLDRRVGWLAATLFLAVPLIKRLSGTGLNDVSLTFYGTAAILSYAHYRQHRSLAWVGMAGLFAGLAAGSKLIGGAFPLLLGLLVVMDAFSSPRLSWRSLLARLALFAGLGLLMVGPWYLRSLAFTGNPVWPFLFHLLGGRNWDLLGDEYHMQSLQGLWRIELPLSFGGLIKSFYYLFFDPVALGGYEGGFGHVQLALVVLALAVVAAFRKAPRLIIELLVFSGSYYIIWFIAARQQIRFLYPILPALMLLAGFAFFIIWDRLSRPAFRWVLAGVLVLLLARSYPLFEPVQRGEIARRLPYLAGRVSREAFLESRIDVLPAIRYINRNLPIDAFVLLLPYETRGYYLDRDYLWGHPMSQRVIRFEQYDDPVALADDLRSLGITHILDSPTWLFTDLRHWDHDRALMLRLESRCGEQLAAWDNIILYRLVECNE